MWKRGTFLAVIASILWIDVYAADGDRPYLTNPAVAGMPEVPILALVPFTGAWRGGHMIRTGGEMAIDIINSQQRILPGYRLTQTWLDDECNPDHAVKTMVQAWNNNQDYVGLGAAGCSAGCMALALIAPNARIPQFSYACASAALSNTAKYPDFNRFMTVENKVVDVIHTLGQRYGWTRVALVSGTPSRFDGPSRYFEEYFRNVDDIEGEWLVPRNPNWLDLVELMKRLRRESQRVVVVFGYTPFYRRVVCASKTAGMPKGVVWISFGWHKAGWWNEDDAELLADDPSCTPTVIAERFEGGIGTAGLGAPDEANMDTPMDCLDGFTSRGFREAAAGYYNDGYPTGENVVPLDLQTYTEVIPTGADGVCVWAYMLRHMLSLGNTMDQLKRPDQATYNEMIRYIKNNMTFRGVGGVIKIEGNDMPAILAINQYQDGEMKTAGTVDPSGMITFVAGLQIKWGDETAPGSEFDACPAGTILQEDRTCKGCDAGQYYDADLQECVQCQAGFINPTEGEIGRQACTPCERGRYAGVTGMTSCIDCSPGQYLLFPGFTACVDCYPGSYTNLGGETECQACALGRFSAETGGSEVAVCAACNEGTYAESQGSTECINCAKGHYAESSGSSACNRCGSGTYQADVGGETCTSCGNNLVTDFLGAIAEAECTCPEGQYRPKVAGQTSPCNSCPKGMTCAAGSDERNIPTAAGGQSGPYPVVQPGFWTSAQSPFSVYMCSGEDTTACPGGVPNQCGDHMQGVVCAECEDEYSLRNGVCQSCTNIETSQFLFPVLPLVLAPTVLTILYWRSGDGYDKWGSWQNGLITLTVLLLSHYQSLALIGGSNSDLPARVADMMTVWAHSNDFMMLFQMDCAGFADFKAGFILRVSAPVLGLVLTGFTYGASQVAQMFDKRLRMEPNRLFSVFMGIVYTFYIGISSLALSLFRCYEHPNGETSLVEAPSVLCGSDQWTQVIVFAILAILIYCVGVLGVFIWVLWVAPERFTNPKFQLRWKFLLMKFRPDVWWWGIAFLVKGVAVNLPFIFFVEGAAQLYWMTATVLAYSWGLVAFFPWRARAANGLEVMICGSLLMLAALSTWFSYKTPALDDTISLVTVVVSFVPFLAFVVAAAEVRFQVLAMFAPQADWTSVQQAFKWSSELKSTLAFAHLSDLDIQVLEKARRIIVSELQGLQASNSRMAQRLVIMDGRGSEVFKDQTLRAAPVEI